MLQSRSKIWLALAVLVASFGLSASVHAQAFSCAALTNFPQFVRAEGFTEQLRDLIIDCTGGVPTLPNKVMPQVDIYVGLDVNLTNKVTAVSSQVEFLDALLLIDEPNSPSHPTTPILNCGRTDAPDNTPAGVGVCSIIGGGALGAANTYNGTVNHPNVFQGRSLRLIHGQTNQVVFTGIPIDPPGTICPDQPSQPVCHRIIRITNLRGDATGRGALQQPSIYAYLAALPNPTVLPIQNPTQEVARSFVSLIGPTVAAGSVSVQEAFSDVFKPRSLTQVLANGVPKPFYAYSGTPNATQSINQNQNVPGAVYDTESTFSDSLGSTHGDNPNNPQTGGVGAGIAFSNQGSVNTSTGITNAGIANQGTRIALQFDIPAGASVQIPQVVQLNNVIGNGVTGVMMLTNADSSGAGPFSIATGTLSAANNIAIYEVLFANPNAIERADVPVTLLNAPPGAILHVVTSYAPFFPATDAIRQASDTLPIPRFIGSSNSVCVVGCSDPRGDLSSGLTNPLFSGTPGNCPTGWICGGGPDPGFASYAPTAAQYPGGSPFATSAFSPTVYGGSGVIRQLTSLTWVGGNTYSLNLWAGLPLTEPDGRSPVSGWPGTYGAVRLYLTMGDGFGQVAAFDIPNPGPGVFALNPIRFTLPTNSGAIGQKIGVMIFVSAPSWYSANFAITPVGN